MIGAGQEPLVALLFQAHTRPAVAADVEERINVILRLADYDDRFIADIEEEIVARLGDTRDVVHQQPPLADYPFHVPPEDFAGAIKWLFEGKAGFLPADQCVDVNFCQRLHVGSLEKKVITLYSIHRPTLLSTKDLGWRWGNCCPILKLVKHLSVEAIP